MRSIRFKFILFVAVILLILLILLNIYPITYSRDQIFEEKRTSMLSQVSGAASMLSSLDSLTEAGVKEVLSYMDLSKYTRTQVTDIDGTVIYDDAGSIGAASDILEIEEALSSKTVFRSAYTEAAFTSSAAMPISIKGNIEGAVYLYENDVTRGAMLYEMQTRIRNITIGIIGAGLVAAAVFSELLVHRMEELVRSIKIVAAGDYSHRLATRGNDEITELGDEFNRMTEKLDTTEKQRRRFVSDASHELKTPLAAIRLLTDSIVQSDGMDTQTMREFVSDIGTEAQRLQHTTELLLDLSRLDDDVSVIPEPVDVKQAIVDAYTTVRPIADEYRVGIKCDLEDGCVVMANREDMYHIAFNLMENAVKYNVPEGTVRVTLKSGDEEILLQVEDTGIGIPEEERLNVFSRFYRVDKARSREAGGSGLGLSIVHDAVLAHGGNITVGANKPQGSVFIVSFPKPTDEETGI